MAVHTAHMMIWWEKGRIERFSISNGKVDGGGNLKTKTWNLLLLPSFSSLFFHVTLLHNKIQNNKTKENVQGIFLVSLLFMFSEAKCEIDFFMCSHLKGHLARNHIIFNHANPYFSFCNISVPDSTVVNNNFLSAVASGCFNRLAIKRLEKFSSVVTRDLRGTANALHICIYAVC